MVANISMDNGNSTQKVKSDTKEENYPNRLKIYDENPSHRNLFSDSKKAHQTVYEVNNKKYVLDEEGIGSGSRNENRYETDLYLAEVLIGMSKVTEHEKIRLALTLPTEHYKDLEISEKIKERFKGVHKLTIDNVRHTYDIQHVSVLPQGYLCLVDYIMEDDHMILNNKHKYTYLIVDIGAGTLDIVETKGLSIVSCMGGNIGSMDFNKNYLRRINNNQAVISDKIKFTLDDIDFIPQQEIYKNMKRYDFTKEYQETCKELAEKIQNHLNRNGIDFSDYDRVLYCGGTSLLIQDYLYKPRNARVYKDALMGNARGGYKYITYKYSKGGQENG